MNIQITSKSLKDAQEELKKLKYEDSGDNYLSAPHNSLSHVLILIKKKNLAKPHMGVKRLGGKDIFKLNRGSGGNFEV